MLKDPGRISEIGNWVCFYINLERRHDRKKNLLRLLESVPLLYQRVQRICAVDGQQLSASGIKALEPEGILSRGTASNVRVPNLDVASGVNTHLSVGDIGCALSHRRAWTQLLEYSNNDGVEWALVLEDDLTVLAADFDTRFRSLLHQLPSDFDICYVGYHGASSSSSGAPLEIHRCQDFSEQGVHGTFGYLISRAGAEKLLRGTPQVQSPFPLTCRLDSAMSRILGGIDAYRVGQNAALLYNSCRQEATDAIGDRVVCRCGRCFHCQHLACCDDFDGSPETSWRPPNEGEHWHFLGLLRQLAEAPRADELEHARNLSDSLAEVEHLQLQLQQRQEQLAALHERFHESQVHCQKLEAEISSLRRVPEVLSLGASELASAIGTDARSSTNDCSPLASKAEESFNYSVPGKPPPEQPSKPKVDVMSEVARICAAQHPAEVLGIAADADDVTMQKAWKKLVFALHPDKLSGCSDEGKAKAGDALHRVHSAKEEFIESSQASGQVDVPDIPVVSGRPVCTRTVPGQRRFECSWQVPVKHDPSRPIEKYEVYGPRIFAHTGEPMEWVLLATLPKIEGCFIFVEESPTQQEVMWAADKIRSPSIPLTVYAINGRGRSEPLYIHLPWQTKFPWLQGRGSLICRQCGCVQPRPLGRSEKFQCVSCDNMISPNAAGVVITCPECYGEALWDDPGMRLDCRCCGQCLAKVGQRQPPKGLVSRGASTPPSNAAQWKNGTGTRTVSMNNGHGGGRAYQGRWT